MTPEEIAAAKVAQLAWVVPPDQTDQDKDEDHQDDQDQDQGDGNDQDKDQWDEDPKALAAQLIEKDKIIAELTAKAEKEKMRAKKSYAKADEVKKTYVSQADVEKILAERDEKVALVAKLPDAVSIMPEIDKLRSENGLSFTDAYALVKGKQMLDPGYRAQISAGRSGFHWASEEVKLDDPIFSQGPQLSKSMTK